MNEIIKSLRGTLMGTLTGREEPYGDPYGKRKARTHTWREFRITLTLGNGISNKKTKK